MDDHPDYQRLITIDGETRRLFEWADEYGHSRQLIADRIARGWDEETAVTKPPRKYDRRSDDGTESQKV